MSVFSGVEDKYFQSQSLMKKLAALIPLPAARYYFFLSLKRTEKSTIQTEIVLEKSKEPQSKTCKTVMQYAHRTEGTSGKGGYNSGTSSLIGALFSRTGVEERKKVIISFSQLMR